MNRDELLEEMLRKRIAQREPETRRIKESQDGVTPGNHSQIEPHYPPESEDEAGPISGRVQPHDNQDVVEPPIVGANLSTGAGGAASVTADDLSGDEKERHRDPDSEDEDNEDGDDEGDPNRVANEQGQDDEDGDVHHGNQRVVEPTNIGANLSTGGGGAGNGTGGGKVSEDERGDPDSEEEDDDEEGEDNQDGEEERRHSDPNGVIKRKEDDDEDEHIHHRNQDVVEPPIGVAALDTGNGGTVDGKSDNDRRENNGDLGPEDDEDDADDAEEEESLEVQHSRDMGNERKEPKVPHNSSENEDELDQDEDADHLATASKETTNDSEESDVAAHPGAVVEHLGGASMPANGAPIPHADASDEKEKEGEVVPAQVRSSAGADSESSTPQKSAESTLAQIQKRLSNFLSELSSYWGKSN